MCVCFLRFSSDCGGLASASFTIIQAGKEANRTSEGNLYSIYGEIRLNKMRLSGNHVEQMFSFHGSSVANYFFAACCARRVTRMVKEMISERRGAQGEDHQTFFSHQEDIQSELKLFLIRLPQSHRSACLGSVVVKLLTSL